MKRTKEKLGGRAQTNWNREYGNKIGWLSGSFRRMVIALYLNFKVLG